MYLPDESRTGEREYFRGAVNIFAHSRFNIFIA